jgi:GntR family transcriptional regulator, transcriptional repressor for pyruvate dehydrogenase complex
MPERQDFALRRIERTPRLSEQIVSQLTNAIQKNVFAYGEYLPSENELMNMFEVSRSVVREALLSLSACGIVDVQKGKGAQVLKPTMDHVLDPFARFVNYKCGNDGLIYILKVRQIIEPKVAGLAAEYRSDAELAHLSECVTEQKRSKEDRIKISDWDIEFHQTLARASQNPVIPIILTPLFDVLMKFHSPVFNDGDVVERTIRSHEMILDAIKEKDSTAAQYAMEDHLTKAEENVQYTVKKKT